MSGGGIQDLIKNIQGMKKATQELNGAIPMIKNFLGNLPGNEELRSTPDEEIKEAIDWAVNRIKKEPHVILGVNEDDPPELIRDVYLVKAKMFHPDGKKPNPEKFRKIEEAYKKLSNG